MKQISGRDLARIVQRRGWTIARISGSHPIFTMPGRRERLSIPVHGNKPLKTGILRAFMKFAGLEESDL